jgi:hypothetical protein
MEAFTQFRGLIYQRDQLIMKTKPILFASCLAAMTLSASVAIAGGHGGSAGGGFSGGGFRGSAGGGGFRGGAGPGRMMPGFARSGSRFGPGMSRNFRGDRDRFRHRDFDDRFVFFGDFGDPFFYPYYGYDPYGYYPYGYGYDPYNYGYGYDPYNQPGYQGVAAGRGSSVGDIQLRLKRAGYYHGRIDGVMGPRTRYAIRTYERSRVRS